MILLVISPKLKRINWKQSCLQLLLIRFTLPKASALVPAQRLQELLQCRQQENCVLLAWFQERSVAERINRHLKQQLANYKVPDVMEYVEEKASLYELQKKVKCWERKVDIASVSSWVYYSAYRNAYYCIALDAACCYTCSVVCLSVCVSLVASVSPANTDQLIDMPFGMWIVDSWSPGSHVRWGPDHLTGRDTFFSRR